MIRGRPFWLAVAAVALLGAALLLLVGRAEAVPRCNATMGVPATDPNKVMRVYGSVNCPGATSVVWRVRILRAGTPWSTNGGSLPVSQPYGYRACVRAGAGATVKFRGQLKIQARFPNRAVETRTVLGPVIHWRCRP